ncbi:MAG: hypothetical protein ACP5ON_11710, partial [Bacteroidota bacterium]
KAARQRCPGSPGDWMASPITRKPSAYQLQSDMSAQFFGPRGLCLNFSIVELNFYYLQRLIFGFKPRFAQRYKFEVHYGEGHHYPAVCFGC